MDTDDGQIDEALWQQLLSLFIRVDTSQSTEFCQTMMTGLHLLLTKVEVLGSSSIFEQAIAVLQTPVVRKELERQQGNEAQVPAQSGCTYLAPSQGLMTPETSHRSTDSEHRLISAKR